MRRLSLLLTILLALSGVGRTQDSTDSAEQELIASTNRFRQAHGLHPLALSSYLQEAARSHSEEMARLNYFDHESPTAERRFPWDRVAVAGADADSVSENIFQARGQSLSELAALAMAAWEKSFDHRKNLLDPEATNQGVGVVARGNQVWVTQVFSSPLVER